MALKGIKPFLIGAASLSTSNLFATTMREYVEMCKGDISKAEALFFRPALHAQVSIKELIEVAASHKSLSMQLVKDSGMQEQLSAEYLVVLCQQEDAAEYILTHDVLKNRLSGYQLCDIGKASVKLASLIIDDPQLKKAALGVGFYGHMLKPHKELAKAGLSDPDFRAACSEYSLSIIAETYHDLAWVCLKDHDLKREFGNASLTTLGKQSLEFALYIFKDPQLKTNLADMGLREIAKTYEQAALVILKDPELLKRLDTQNFLSWVTPAHYVVAKFSLEEDGLKAVLMDDPNTLKRIGASHIGLIDTVLATGKLTETEAIELQAKKGFASKISELLRDNKYGVLEVQPQDSSKNIKYKN